MYSKNDYRYYLEHRMAEENYLAHYGIRGMKWRKRKASVEITDLKNERTGEVYKSSKKPSKKKLFVPKNQKVEIVTNKKKKRSKREAKWNRQMQQYGREILSEQKR